MKFGCLFSKSSSLSLTIVAAAIIISSNLSATKVWIENKTDKPLTIRFSGIGLAHTIKKDTVRTFDNIVFTQLKWFSINNHEVIIPENLRKG